MSDGTNFKILYHAGTVNKFMIKMDGSGFCGMPFLDSCVDRLSCPWGCGGSATWGEDQTDIIQTGSDGALSGWYQNLKNQKDNKRNWFIDGMTWQNNPLCLHQLGWY